MSLIFSQEAVELFERNYRNKVRPRPPLGGCMIAVYIGLSSLFGSKYGFRGAFHIRFLRASLKREKRKGLPEGQLNTIDRVFRALEDEGVVYPEQRFTRRSGNWEIDDSQINSIERELVDQVAQLPDGSHFFGMAVHDAWHSIILRLHKDNGKTEVYWMDQFSKGFDAVRAKSFVRSPRVTGKLDQEILEIGKHPTSVWLFDPEQASNILIEVDADGDGSIDNEVSAVESALSPHEMLIDL